MPVITFSDGNKRKYKNSISILDIVRDVSPNLIQDCIFGYMNNVSINKNALINNDVTIKIMYKNDQETLNIIRNSCIYILGKAVKTLWPTAKIANYSILNKGFYLDIEVDFSFNQNNLKLLETLMFDIIKKKHKFKVKIVAWKKAYEIFKDRLETYKLIILDEILMNNNLEYNISLCSLNKYVDFCKNGMVTPDVSVCKYFKLQKFSGVYWKNSKDNKVLQRIYGTAWSTKDQLENYCDQINNMDKRDHRKISRSLDLYHIQEDLPGMIFWHHNGWIIFKELKQFMRVKLKEYNYEEVNTPIIMNKKIWKDSGHLDNYYQSIFMTSSDNAQYGIKPMSCPGHVQIFNNALRSYKELPIRLSEFGSCHRKESSGSLHGLMRIRNFTQDDAHIFCRDNQIRAEISNCIKMVYDVYKIFGFKKILVKLSTRPKNRIGNDVTWDRAERDLADALKENNISFEYQNGEGAFYGPKIEISLLDCLDRIWQCATIQLDFCLPLNLNTYYINEKNQRAVPILIHRAILGSIERFIGILIEEYSGNFPTWLSPIQVLLVNVNQNHCTYVKRLFKLFLKNNIRVKLDLRNEKINFKIRESIICKVPYVIICGNREVEQSKITIRVRTGKSFLMNIQEFILILKKEINNRSLNNMGE